MVVLSCDGCEEPAGGTGITITGDQTGVDQTKLNDIKAAFEKYYPDIKIEVTDDVTGRTGTTIKLARGYITTNWTLGMTSTQIRAEIDAIYSHQVSKVHDNGYKLMTGKSVQLADAVSKRTNMVSTAVQLA
jgi:hypothetical protein